MRLNHLLTISGLLGTLAVHGFEYKCTSDGKGYTQPPNDGVQACPEGQPCVDGQTAPCAAPNLAAPSAPVVGGAIASSSGTSVHASASAKAPASTPKSETGNSNASETTAVESKGNNTAGTAASSASTAKSSSSTSESGKSGNSSSITTGKSTGGKRFVAYWQVYDAYTGVEAEQLEGVTDLILAFIDMNTFTEWVTSTNGKFDAGLISDLRSKKKDMRIMAALGGWGFNAPFEFAANSTSNYDTFVKNAVDFVTKYDLDGLTLDWEFPTVDMKDGLKKIVSGIRAGLPEGATLGLDLGARVDITSPYGHVDSEAFDKDMFTELDKSIDFYNLMTYDYVNRYDNKTGHASGGEVVQKTIDWYKKNGIDMTKTNIGFEMSAKFFQLQPGYQCENKPLGCDMGGVAFFETDGKDNNKSGWMRYNPDVDATLSLVEGASIKQVARPSWASKGTDDHDFPDALANAWLDETNNVFWSWTSPENNKKVCEKYKSEVGGVMFWAINQDENGMKGGPHIKALADCMAGGQ
ncbi:hypothetical protein IAU60_000606 [Kwoniella sp. DSM 27419]